MTYDDDRDRSAMLYGGIPLPSRLLSADEERELISAYRNGDASAGDTLVRHNVKWALKVASRMRKRYRISDPGEIDDLYQIAVCGLHRALGRFDPDRARFTTYATWWIRQAVQRELLNDRHVVHVPAGAYQDGVRVDVESLNEPLSARIPCVDKKIDKLPGDWGRPQQMVDYTTSRHLRDALHHAVDYLDDRQRTIMLLRHLSVGGASLRELGGVLGLTRERVRQLEAHALVWLRGYMLRRRGGDELIDLAGGQVPEDARPDGGIITEQRVRWYVQHRIDDDENLTADDLVAEVSEDEHACGNRLIWIVASETLRARRG